MPPPNKYIMNSFEGLLTIITIAVVFPAIILSLCIGFVLQIHCTGCTSHVENPDNRAAAGKPITPQIVEKPPTRIDLKYLVSVNIPQSSDDKKKMKFACPGIILTKFWILTGELCVKNEDEWGELEIRTGSEFWNIGGDTYAVTEISRSKIKGPVALKSKRPIQFGKNVVPVKIPGAEFDVRNFCGATGGWSVHKIGEWKEYDSIKWSNNAPCFKNRCKTGKIVTVSDCEFGVTGRGLVTIDNYLIGLECSGYNKQTKFIEIKQEFAGWLEKLTGELELQKLQRNALFSSSYVITESRTCKHATPHDEMKHGEFAPSSSSPSTQFLGKESAAIAAGKILPVPVFNEIATNLSLATLFPASSQSGAEVTIEHFEPVTMYTPNTSNEMVSNGPEDDSAEFPMLAIQPRSMEDKDSKEKTDLGSLDNPFPGFWPVRKRSGIYENFYESDKNTHEIENLRGRKIHITK